MGNVRGTLCMWGIGVAFLYYTMWVIVTPFVAVDHVIHHYFPARRFAILIPCLLFTVTLSVLGAAIGLTMLRESSKLKHAKRAV